MSITHLQIDRESFALADVFTISRGSRTSADVITVTVTRDGHRGRGECVPYARYGESLDSVVAQIESVRDQVEHGIDGEACDAQRLQTLLPAGAARNALDCAFWDLAGKSSGRTVCALADLAPLVPVVSAYTLSLDTPEKMQAKAREHAERPLLKIKLGGNGDLDRLRAVRAGAPDCRLIVDANEGWSRDEYVALAPQLLALGVDMVEQPLPSGDDEALRGLQRPLPVCADESCHDVESLAALHGKYDMINIKLDKTGGLTEALRLRSAARAAGFDIMVGCMVGTSLAMAPALVVAQGADIVDLDGPLLLAEDRQPPLRFTLSTLHPSVPELWG